MAFRLLQEGREAAGELASALQGALANLGRCHRCRMLTEGEACSICASPQRDPTLLCVVESPADVMAIEAASTYRGKYFVLMGHLSPLDGIGPEQLGLAQLERLLGEGTVREVILATNPTVEGEATAHFISTLAQGRGVASSRIAHGVPIGGELEYVDGGTLAHAIQGRHTVG
jgi:recombination protein RecR